MAYCDRRRILKLSLCPQWHLEALESVLSVWKRPQIPALPAMLLLLPGHTTILIQTHVIFVGTPQSDTILPQTKNHSGFS